MTRGTSILTFAMFFMLSTVALAAAFKVYPGAKVEEVYEAKQSATGAQTSKSPKVTIFTTTDFFDTVVAFYRRDAREYRMPGMGGKPMKLSTGQELKEAYFIFDDASDIMTSKHWIKIQRPYLVGGRTGEISRGKMDAVRDVTAIIEEDKRTYP